MTSLQVRKLEGAGRPGKAVLVALVCALVLGACMSVSPQKVSMVPVASADRVSVIQLSRMVNAVLPNESVATLPASSRWQRIGALPQGDVYRPLSGLFTIQTPRPGEAYIVASSGKLVGFYLPGEAAYLPLSRPVALPVEMRQ